MEILISFAGGILTTVITQLAKKYKVPPRLIIGIMAASLVASYTGFSMLLGKAKIDEALTGAATVFATWYSTTTVVYEWIYKLFLQKKTGK